MAKASAAKAGSAAKAATGKAVKTAQTAQAARATRAAAKAGASGPAGADYDAIVVGGGHNGLVAARLPGQAGARTVVLEARPKVGGAAATEAPWPDAPDFKVTRYSYVMSLMPPTILNDLQLERHGYKVYPMGPYYQAFPEGGSIKLYADDAKRNRERSRRSRRRTPTPCRRWDAWMDGMADVLGPLLITVPPKLGSKRPGTCSRPAAGWPGSCRGLDVRDVADVTRLFTMSVADLLDDWFESPQVKARAGRQRHHRDLGRAPMSRAPPT